MELEDVFIAIGHIPNSEIFEGQLKMKNGYVVVETGEVAMRRRRCAWCVRCWGYSRSGLSSGGDKRRLWCMAALDAEKFWTSDL